MSQIPSIGTTVLYTLTSGDAEAINQRRTDAHASLDMHRKYRTGAVIHVGNAAHEGDIYPMLITRVWGNTPETQVNGQVFLDGNDCIWVTSVGVGEGPRTFSYLVAA